MRTLYILVLACLSVSPAFARPSQTQACYATQYAGDGYSVCIFNPKQDDIRLFHKAPDGTLYGHFDNLIPDLAKRNEALDFAMNGGMYHADRAPVGGYIEGGKVITPMNTRAGKGNFFMKPNGVFWTWEEDGYSGGSVMSTPEYIDNGTHDITAYATQSGPMLVIDGKLHSKFRKASNSRRLRNGVGELEDGRIAFVISDGPVNFFNFASFFKDNLKSENALYLDGVISRLYAPALNRNDKGAVMGPIIGVVRKKGP